MEWSSLPIVVIAAAGNARRFHGEQKVLAPIGGVPAVSRVAQTCEEGLGPHRQLVVVGHAGDQVQGVLGQAHHREFVRQHPPLGTGHALATALNTLNGTGATEVYFFCGDKPLLTAASVRRLRTRLLTSGAAMAFLTSRLQTDPRESRQGRVVQAHPGTPRAEVLAIVERATIDALGPGETLTFHSHAGEEWQFTREQLLAIPEVNVSAYAWRMAPLRECVPELRPHPCNGEYLVTDLVEALRRRRYLVRAFPVGDGAEAIGIDTQELLEKAKQAWAELRGAAVSLPPRRRRVGGSAAGGSAASLEERIAGGLRCSELLRALAAPRPEQHQVLVAIYGSPLLAEQKRRELRRLLRRFRERWGDRPVWLVRAPARIALNPHCEHQGAWVPYGTHRREILAVAAARADDLVTLTNLDPSYQESESFRLAEELTVAPDAWAQGWIQYIEDPRVAARRQTCTDPAGRREGKIGGINFVRAATLRLAREARGARRGMDLVVSGDIPVGVGQSSSSALVVLAALVLNECWGLELTPEQLVPLCGEAEWYVGTRGGAGDHAAMLLGSREGLVGVRFQPPVTVRETRPLRLPPGVQLIVANSGVQAIKNSGARCQFNSGIFAYRFALLYLQDALQRRGDELSIPPALREARFLADVNTSRYPLETIYRLLLDVPETVTAEELRQRHPESYAQGAMSCFGTTDPALLPQSIPVRGAALYGLGRVDRGLVMHELCGRGDEEAMAEFGRLMLITHDGDRVTRYDPATRTSTPYRDNLESVSDAHLLALAGAAAQGPGSAGWEAAQLCRQSGFYGASTPELDQMVDTALSLPEVLGAGLMGAGGGGCILVLARAGQEAFGQVRRALAAHYYRPARRAVLVEAWHPTAAACQVPLAPVKASAEGRPALALGEMRP